MVTFDTALFKLPLKGNTVNSAKLQTNHVLLENLFLQKKSCIPIFGRKHSSHINMYVFRSFAFFTLFLTKTCSIFYKHNLNLVFLDIRYWISTEKAILIYLCLIDFLYA